MVKKLSVSVKLKFVKCKCGCGGYIASAGHMPSYWIWPGGDGFFASKRHTGSLDDMPVDEDCEDYVGFFKDMRDAERRCNKDAGKRLLNMMGVMNARVREK